MNIPLNLLSLDNTLTLLAVNGLLPLLQPEEGVKTGQSTAEQPHTPGTVSVLLQTLHRSQLAVSDGVDNGDRVEGQVSSVTELATDSQVAEDRVDGGLVVESEAGGLEVLDELADTHDLACRAKLLLHRIVRVNSRLRSVRAVQVPGVEAREVLQGTEELVATDCVVDLCVSVELVAVRRGQGLWSGVVRMPSRALGIAIMLPPSRSPRGY